MTLSTDNLFNDVMSEILTIVESNNLIDYHVLEKLVKKAYIIVREDPSIIDDFYDILNIFVHNVKNKLTEDGWAKLLSIIALKNDMVLQKQLSERQIDIYLEEVEFVISNQLNPGNEMIIAKIGECLAKIQYAYNLIDSKKNISNIFFEFMKNIVINNQFKSLILLFNNEEWPDSYSIGMLFYYYMFFKDEPKPKLNIFKVFHKNYFIVTFWKQFKINYYEMTKEEVEKEGYESYDFIYR